MCRRRPLALSDHRKGAMPDEPTEPSATDGAPDSKPAEIEPSKDEPLGEGGKKALDAERARVKELEAKLKEAEPLVAKAKELEEATKSEAQRQAEAIAAEKARGDTAQLALLRHEVADDKKLPPEAKALLSGSTREELEASADALIKLLGDQGKGERRPDPTLGDTSGGKPNNAEDWFRKQLAGN